MSKIGQIITTGITLLGVAGGAVTTAASVSNANNINVNKLTYEEITEIVEFIDIKELHSGEKFVWVDDTTGERWEINYGQYKKLLEYDNVELEVEEKAVELIAKKAQAKKTGARGLRAIFEEIMTDVMYDVPSNENVKKVVITESAVENKKPLLVMKDKEKKEA